MTTFRYYPSSEFRRIAEDHPSESPRLSLIAAMARLNALVAIKKAGSGHLGSSLSATDIMVWLYHKVMNVADLGLDDPDRDIFFSSKGHDVPGQYSVLLSAGLLTEARLFQLRRFNGLDGHPDVHVRGCESNTGSLGMGISKARGQSWAKRHLGRQGRVFVMTGDGELQEGQIWESIQTCVHHRVPVTVIVDHNKIQTDLPVAEIISLGDLVAKFRVFGCAVERCDGHDFSALDRALEALDASGLPCRILLADTIKGRGVSFMEEIATTTTAAGKYLWHSGAPADGPFTQAFSELERRVAGYAAAAGLAAPVLAELSVEPASPSGVSKEFVAAAYGEELCAQAERNPAIVVLDGDLAADCRVRAFSERFPERFIENGIAEQDMVSVAGGMARQGVLPFVNSFSSFLCARANEQIYNNACEGTRIVYAAHFAGMIPAGPGKSHQSVRDIGLLGSIPNLTIIQPCNAAEARLAVRYAVHEAKDNICLRLNIGPSPRSIETPDQARLRPGCGTVLRPGRDAVLFAYGPVLLHEALVAAEVLQGRQFSLSIVNLPWLNRFDPAWLRAVLQGQAHVYTLDDHMLDGGMGERLLAFIAEQGIGEAKQYHRFGLTQYPGCGTPREVLRHHRLDGESLAQEISARQGIGGVLRPQGNPSFDAAEAPQ